MKTLVNENCLFVDCDDSLVMWDNKYKAEDLSNCVNFTLQGELFQLVPNEENIKYLKNHVLLNKGTVIVWSAGGWEWAEEVVKTLHLTNYVKAVMSKPTRYLDDLPANEFMGERIWKDIK